MPAIHRVLFLSDGGLPGLTAVYSPLKHYGLDKPGMKVGVVGLGGLGHTAVLIGKVPSAARSVDVKPHAIFHPSMPIKLCAGLQEVHNC